MSSQLCLPGTDYSRRAVFSFSPALGANQRGEWRRVSVLFWFYFLQHLTHVSGAKYSAETLIVSTENLL